MTVIFKRLVALALVLFLAWTQAGCESTKGLSDLVVVMGIGLDKDADRPENIKLVAQVVLPDKIAMAEGASHDDPYCNVESSAENTFEAIREYTHVVCAKLYIAHNQAIVIGREVAEQGVAEHLDFFVRARETRPTTVVVISDTTAAEALSVKPKLNILPAINIKRLLAQQKENSQSMEADIVDYINAMQSPTASFLAPIVRVVQMDDYQLVSVKGLAVFKKDKMAGELDEDETRGLFWVKGLVESGVISVSLDGQKAAVEITKVSTRLSPEIKDGKIIMNLQIREEGTLATQSGSDNLATAEAFRKIEELVRQEILHEIALAVNKARELKADIFGFGELLSKYRPNEWQSLKNDWDRIFSTVEINADIEASITGSGIVIKPALSES